MRNAKSQMENDRDLSYFTSLLRSVRHCCRHTLALQISGVVLHKLLHLAVSEARVEVVFLHLRVDLIVVPVVVVEAVNRAHHTRAMPATGAVHVELSG